MAKRSRKEPARVSVGELHRPRKKRGFGIGLKFAIPVSVAITILMGVVGWTVYGSTADALDESIDRAGVFAATTLAAPDWAVKDNTDRLAGMLTDKVEDVVIYEKDAAGGDSFFASATKREQLKLDPDASSRRVVGLTTIERGVIESKDGEWVNYRSFRRNITSPANPSKPIAAVQVYLSEEAIKEELASLLNKIILFSILGIVAGIAISFMVAKVITQPVDLLIKDIEIVAKGNLQHQTRARSSDEIGTLAEAFDEMTRGLEEGTRAKQDLTSKEHQEHIAQEIQEKLFPSSLPELDGCAVGAVFEAGSEISSDLFDFVHLDDGRTGMLLMSASGRGVPAAIILAMARSVFRAVAPAGGEAAETLRKINALFSPDLRRGMYVTAMYGVYDPKTHELTVASAGHKMPVLHYSHERKSMSRVHPGGIAMGLDKGPIFDKSMEEAKIQVASHDTVLLGTAGVVNLQLKSGEPVGESRFFKAALTTIQSGKGDVARNLVSRVDANLADDPGEHDITVVALRRE